MSDPIPKVCTGCCNTNCDDEEEKLRIRKNSTNVDIPPRSPELARPVVDPSDEQCKPVNLPRPISL